MKKNAIILKSATDAARPITAADWEYAKFRIGGKDVSRAEWKAAARAQIGKERITIMLDADVLAAYKAQAGARGYQTLINQALRRDLDQAALEHTLRRVMREELRAGKQ